MWQCRAGQWQWFGRVGELLRAAVDLGGVCVGRGRGGGRAGCFGEAWHRCTGACICEPPQRGPLEVLFVLGSSPTRKLITLPTRGVNTPALRGMYGRNHRSFLAHRWQAHACKHMQTYVLSSHVPLEPPTWPHTHTTTHHPPTHPPLLLPPGRRCTLINSPLATNVTGQTKDILTTALGMVLFSDVQVGTAPGGKGEG